MKIAIGMNMQPGPYGGGNQFGQSLTARLKDNDIAVVHTLDDHDIDVILVTEIRPWLEICAFSLLDAVRYRQQHDTPIVLRINECDERKGKKIKLLNEALRAASALADQTVYISAWLKEKIADADPALHQRATVIRNGADEGIFNSHAYTPWDGVSPLKVVTHHWSSHLYKGWDIYQLLDRLIDTAETGKIEFTYIGSLPKTVQLARTRTVPPLMGRGLSAELQQHHVYLTASINEPAGMHHIEGAMCGLPLLYRQSGALPEYSEGFGIAFTDAQDFPRALTAMKRRYHDLQKKMTAYPNTASRMVAAYQNVFRSVLTSRPSASLNSWGAEMNLKAKLAALRLADHIPIKI